MTDGGFTKEDAANIALAAAKEAVRQSNNELFAIMGVNAADQRSLTDLRDDMIWVRSSRRMSTLISQKFTLGFIGLIVVAIGYAIIEGARSFFSH